MAAIISNRRKDRSPIFVVAPSRGLPPVECCRGTNPIQAAKSRPLRNVSGRREDNQSRNDQRPNSWGRHQPARHLILFGTPTGLGVELGDLIIEAGLRLDQNQQRCPNFLRQATCRTLYDRPQVCCVCYPLGNRLSKFRPVAAKRIEGRTANSQMASVSAASFFWRLTKGLT